VKTDNSSVANLIAGTGVTITGTTQAQAEKGIYEFDDFVIIAEPSTDVGFSI